MVKFDELEFITQITSAPSNEVATNIFFNAIEQFGYSQFIYALIPTDQNGDLGEYVNLNTFDPEWMKFYTENGLHESDYAAWYATTHTAPLNWADMFSLTDTGAISRAEIDTANKARDFGLIAGTTIPLQHLGRYHAGVSLAADDALTTSEHDRLFSQNVGQLIWLSDILHTALDRCSLATDHYRLTKREVEVLQWLSEGYQVAVIAHKMGIRETTVHQHSANARQHLKAATTTQAVARAVMLGVIQ